MAKKKKKHRLKKSAKRQLLFLLVGVLIVVGIGVVSVQLNKKKYAVVGIELKEVASIELMHDYIPEGRQNRSQVEREIRYIVLHETGNTASSASALNHLNYLNTNLTDVNSWHYTVDEHMIIHHLPDHEIAWHAGDETGNLYGIGIEMCVNEGADFEATVDNAAQLVAALLKAYHLDMSAVKRHKDFSGKNCPEHYQEDDQWEIFLSYVEKYYKK